jgi:hypothetical protein
MSQIEKLNNAFELNLKEMLIRRSERDRLRKTGADLNEHEFRRQPRRRHRECTRARVTQ